jgi:hypothetical protein
MVVRKIGRQRKADLTMLSRDMEHELLRGKPFIFTGIDTPLEELREAWAIHRGALLNEWLESNPPGTRPFAMYLFELVPKFGERKLTPAGKDLVEYRDNWTMRGLLHTHLSPPAQEPECEYLFRHGVIDAAEYQAARQKK